MFGKNNHISYLKRPIIQRTVIKNVIHHSPNQNATQNSCQNQNLTLLSDISNSLVLIQEQYINNVVNKNYDNIPSFNNYLYLYETITNEINSTTNNSIKLLLMITLGSLQTSNQAQILYEENAFLQESKEALEKQLEDILSNKNENYAFSTEGQYNLSQDYILAPLFTKYIQTYGLPAYGEGFDPDKLLIIKSTM